MIAVRGREYDLPLTLLVCPSCRRGTLEWDGRWSWRCNATATTTDIDGHVTIKPSCSRGFALSGLYSNNSLEAAFETSYVNLHRLQLSATAVSLIRQGLVRLPYLLEGELELQARRVESDERAHEQNVLVWEMRQLPPYRRGGL